MRLLEQQTLAQDTFGNVTNSLQLADVQEELEAMIQNVQQMAAAVTPPTTPTQTQFSPTPTLQATHFNVPQAQVGIL